MALSPAPPPAMPGAAPGAMAGGDPMAGAGAGGDADTDADDQVVVTICKDGQGGYTVYAGDEPESGAGDADMSEDDTAAMGPAGAAPAPNGGAPTPQGIPADSMGAALKAAMDIMQSDASASGGSNPEDNFSSGFGPAKPAPARGIAQKY